MNFKTIKDKFTSKINKQSVKGFFQKQGLYVLIFLCLAAAGITAIVAWPRDDAENQMGDSGQDASVIEAPTLEEELAKHSPRPMPSPLMTPEPEPSEQAQVTDTPVAVSNGKGSVKLTKPVKGQVINGFSGDSLVFFASLNVWATHNGCDIKADRGADVVAALSGTVSDVHTNEADGGVVVIEHAGKTTTMYAGLEDICVKKGDKVDVGQKIGKIGEMPRELDLSYHLHFEYIVDGKYKDPSKYF